MMFTRHLELLLAVAFLLLAGFGMSGHLLLRGIEARRRVQVRITGVVVPLLPEPTGKPRAIARAKSIGRRGLTARAAWIFGFDPALARRYPCPWWVVLPLAFIAARLVCGVAEGLLGSMALLLLPVLWIGLVRNYFASCNAKARRRLLMQMPDALAMIMRAVRVGIPVTEAIDAVGREMEPPSGVEFRMLHQELLMGVPLDAALKEMGRRTELPEYRFFATAVALQAQTGGGLSEVLENLADLVRRRLALQSRGHALSAEARTSAAVLSVLPPMTGAMLWMISPDYIGLLFHNPTGRALVGGAVLSLGAGIFMMRLIIRRTLA